MFSETDIAFMQHALVLAAKGCFTARPNPMVGAVLVKDNQIIGEGYHVACGQMHAEVMALQQAVDPMGATCYVTLEPCVHQGRTAPCVDALIAAGISRVVVAMSDPNPLVAGKGIITLREHGITVDVGLLDLAAQKLNLGFISRFKRGRPYVIAKIAMSLDGRIAMASGESQWITGPEAREQVQTLRAECGAIITGANTVLSDNPRMTVRSEAVLSQIASDVNFQPPLRVVLDRNKRIPMDAEILSNEAPTWHMTAQQDLHAVMKELAAREINQVLVEAGPQLVGALLTENLVDELVLFYAPKLLGHEGKPMATLPNMTSLAQHIPLTIQSIQQVGPDICVRVSV